MCGKMSNGSQKYFNDFPWILLRFGTTEMKGPLETLGHPAPGTTARCTVFQTNVKSEKFRVHSEHKLALLHWKCILYTNDTNSYLDVQYSKVVFVSKFIQVSFSVKPNSMHWEWLNICSTRNFISS